MPLDNVFVTGFTLQWQPIVLNSRLSKISTVVGRLQYSFININQWIILSSQSVPLSSSLMVDKYWRISKRVKSNLKYSIDIDLPETFFLNRIQPAIASTTSKMKNIDIPAAMDNDTRSKVTEEAIIDLYLSSMAYTNNTLFCWISHQASLLQCYQN